MSFAAEMKINEIVHYSRKQEFFTLINNNNNK